MGPDSTSKFYGINEPKNVRKIAKIINTAQWGKTHKNMRFWQGICVGGGRG